MRSAVCKVNRSRLSPRLTIEFVGGQTGRAKFLKTAEENGLQVVVREDDIQVIKVENS